jgi:ubiquitin-protein ligase
VYKNGELCISILHEPGADQYGYEDAGERWLPVHTVESIVRVSLSLFSLSCRRMIGFLPNLHGLNAYPVVSF